MNPVSGQADCLQSAACCALLISGAGAPLGEFSFQVKEMDWRVDWLTIHDMHLMKFCVSALLAIVREIFAKQGLFFFLNFIIALLKISTLEYFLSAEMRWLKGLLSPRDKPR